MEKKTGFFKKLKIFWFVITKNPKEDFFVSLDNSMWAFDWDKVEIEIYPKKLWKNREAKIMKIIPTNMEKNIKEDDIIWIYRQKNHFWFVDVIDEETGDKKWYYVYEKNSNTAFDWDEVVAEIADFNWKKEAIIKSVLKRADRAFVWTLQKKDNFAFVVLDNPDYKKDIFISGKNIKKTADGNKVWIKIINFKWKNPEWIIVNDLWKPWDRWVDILWVAVEGGARLEFGEKVKKEVADLNPEIEKEELERRKNLKNLFTITIDWADSKDLDDAISVKKMDSGDFKLYVHIADVAHYVTENSAIDKEALNRWNSIYLVDKVIPMLPEKLSNDLCSLNPDTIKLTMTSEVLIWRNWKIKESKVYESYIKTNFRMTYKEVEQLTKDWEALEKWWLTKLNIGEKLMFWEKNVTSELVEMLKNSEELRWIIRRNKKDLWVLDFDFPEAKIIVDETGFPIEIKKYPRYNSNKIIEEFMIMANEAVSKQFSKLPFLYRVHTEPKDEDIEKLRRVLNIFNFNIPFEKVIPKSFQILLKQIEEAPSFYYLQRIILRAMTKAYYDVEVLGHFGLALEYYSHFTSPIRRYSDLQIHRVMKEELSGELNNVRVGRYKKILKEVANTCSEQEVFAQDMERKVKDIMFAKYMEKHIWEEFDGKIVWIIEKWFFVELDNTIEGFVAIEVKKSKFDAEMLTLEIPEKKYSLWDKVRIKVESVDKVDGKIDFEEI